MPEINKANLGKQSPDITPTKGSSTYGLTGRGLVGWINNDISPLSKDYKVCIHSVSLKTTVVAALQEQVTFRITSEWDSFLPLGDFNLANQVSQLAGYSPITKFSTRRIWKGTSPIALNLKLRFQSVVDTKREVMDPYLALMSMILPGEGAEIGKTGIKIPFIKPPGPGPFYSKTAQKVGGKKVAGFKGGDKISVGIGRFFFLPSVIVREVVPVFDMRVDEFGQPISAEITVVLETYEILTKADMKKAFASGGNSQMV
jgi:hypothetical protein